MNPPFPSAWMAVAASAVGLNITCTTASGRGWRQGAHTTIGLYGHLQHRASHDLSYKEYGLGAGIHYAIWRVEDQRAAGLAPQVLPELGLRWQVSQRLSLNMGYRYSLNLPLGNSAAYRGGQFLFGVRFEF